jgi:ribonuclease D
MMLEDFQLFDGDLSEFVADALALYPILAIDTEAMGLLPQRDRLCLVQICTPEGQVVLVRFVPQDLAKGAPHLKRIMEHPQVLKVFHYARFDIGMLKAHLGIQTQPIFCTKIASKLARTYTNRHGLKDVVLELTGTELDKTAQSSDWGAVHELTEAQLRYAANDVRFLIPVQEKLEAMLEREGRARLAYQCFHALETVVDLDLAGYGNVFEHGG